MHIRRTRADHRDGMFEQLGADDHATHRSSDMAWYWALTGKLSSFIECCLIKPGHQYAVAAIHHGLP